MALSWIIAGGGTGGHVTPALALGEAIARREAGDRILFIGSDRGLEARLVPEAGFQLEALPSRQVMGLGPLGRVLGALSILRAALHAQRAIGRFRADLVVSVGGYAAMPSVIAAALRRTPLILVEPNAQPGRVNRLAARVARRVFVGSPAAVERLGLDPDSQRARCVGVPLRESLIAAFRNAPERRPLEAPYHLLVFGGSQGARQINQAVMDALPLLGDLPLRVFHQAGEADRERVEAAYAKSGIEAEVVDFEPEMPKRYRWADLALCRSGALTVAELALAALPALLVPYPFAADDHQSANARELEVAGAARRLDPAKLDGERLAAALRELLDDPSLLAAMSGAASDLGRPDAAHRVIQECVALLEELG
jgi:UDP-N-acetylglucosamine--N-acetylmuramyl-(pentapeptide) pyrophosphoryl-undecaprenol N-acetylglucosamine transferase